MTTIRGDFDELAAAYDVFRTGYSDDLYDTLASFGIRSGTTCLDIGCGTGLATIPLAQRGVTMTGIDRSVPMLDAARPHAANVTFREGSAEALPFADRSFDNAISAQAFHWFDQPKALAEAQRVVKPGGVVAIWWKNLVDLSPIRTLRARAAARAGVSPPDDLNRGGFRAFYAAPFAEHTLRVIPYSIFSDAERWIGYETSRRRAHDAYGERFDAYIAALKAELASALTEPDAIFEVRYTQYLYIGKV